MKKFTREEIGQLIIIASCSDPSRWGDEAKALIYKARSITTTKTESAKGKDWEVVVVCTDWEITR